MLARKINEIITQVETQVDSFLACSTAIHLHPSLLLFFISSLTTPLFFYLPHYSSSFLLAFYSLRRGQDNPAVPQETKRIQAAALRNISQTTVVHNDQSNFLRKERESKSFICT